MAEKILCVTNVTLDMAGGRADALKTRVETLEEHGFEVDFFLIKKPYKSLSPLILHKFKKTISNSKYKIVWSMNNPFTLHIPPLLFKMAGYDFKWIAEFRDPIYLNPDPKKFKFLYKIIEVEIIKYANGIIIPKGTQADLFDYSREYDLNSSNTAIFTLPYAGTKIEKCKNSKYVFNLPFTITYAGSFYKGWIEPLTFIKGLKLFIVKNNLTSNHLRVNFFGDWRSEFKKLIQDLGIDEYVHTWGWIKKSELKRHLESSHLYLYIAGSLPANKKNVSFKIWDYICYCKPILALCGKNSVLRDFITKNRFGYPADYDDPKDIAAKLSQAYSDFKQSLVVTQIKKMRKNRLKFDRKHHDETFAQILLKFIEEEM